MSNARNLSDLLGTGSTIATAKIADDAITSAKIADDAVVTAAIADDAITSALIATDAVVADGLSSSAITSGDLPAGSVLQVKKSISQNASTTTITASTTPAQLYSANTTGRTYELAQTITITPASTSNILYCISQVNWTSMAAHSTGAHGHIITLNDASSIDNYDFP